jgi:L-seryl-tRNA(Ser) seleniumtransferase
MKEHLSKLPSVNRLLEILTDESKRINTIYLKKIVSGILEDIKENPKSFQLDKKSRTQIEDYIIAQSKIRINKLLSPALKRVVNATGVILHTGLGRAPLGTQTVNELKHLAYYTNLEIDLETGKRGERLDHVTTLIKIITGAEDAVVVNNNAAAVLLSLNSLARKKEVLVSRGELVEIGGSFRMPEVMHTSLAKMIEIGSTNKTHLDDYISAISDKTAAIMLVHTSNFEIIGFTYKPALYEIVEVAHKHGLPIIYDLGSGALEDMKLFNLGSEPVVRDIIDADVDIVTFSGDKLLGGPQSGIIAGKLKYVKLIRQNHLLRALRCDKITLSLLNGILRDYLLPENLTQTNTTLQLFSRPKKTVSKLAHNLIAQLNESLKKSAHVINADGRVGSGAFPVFNIPTVAVQIEHPGFSANRMAYQLRHNDIPVIGTIDQDRLVLNFLAVYESDIDVISTALNKLT